MSERKTHKRELFGPEVPSQHWSQNQGEKFLKQLRSQENEALRIAMTLNKFHIFKTFVYFCNYQLFCCLPLTAFFSYLNMTLITREL